MNIGDGKENPVFYAKAINEVKGRKDPISFKVDTYNTWSKIQESRFVDEFLPNELNPRLDEALQIKVYGKDFNELENNQQEAIKLLLACYLINKLKISSILNFGRLANVVNVASELYSVNDIKKLTHILKLSQQDAENMRQSAEKQSTIVSYIRGFNKQPIEETVYMVVLYGVLLLGKPSKKIGKFLKIAIEENLINDLSLIFNYPEFANLLTYLPVIEAYILEMLSYIPTDQLITIKKLINQDINFLIYYTLAERNLWDLCDKYSVSLGMSQLDYMIKFLKAQTSMGHYDKVLSILEDRIEDFKKCNSLNISVYMLMFQLRDCDQKERVTNIILELTTTSQPSAETEVDKTRSLLKNLIKPGKEKVIPAQSSVSTFISKVSSSSSCDNLEKILEDGANKKDSTHREDLKSQEEKDKVKKKSI
jgi:hypothetical protein